MSKRHRNAHPCPTGTKTPYGTEAEAHRALAYLRDEPAIKGEKKPQRAYLCACRQWHLTSQGAWS